MPSPQGDGISAETKPPSEGFYPSGSRVSLFGERFGKDRLDAEDTPLGKVYAYAKLAREARITQTSGDIITWDQTGIQFRVPVSSLYVDSVQFPILYNNYVDVCFSSAGCQSKYIKDMSPNLIVSISGRFSPASGESFIRLYPKFEDSTIEKMVEIVNYESWSWSDAVFVLPSYNFSSRAVIPPGSAEEFAPYFLLCTQHGCASNLVKTPPEAEVRLPEIFALSKSCRNAGEVLTIYGANFGYHAPHPSGFPRVVFHGDIVPQDSDYIFWSESAIEVKVPNPFPKTSVDMGGKIRVEMQNGMSAESLDVFYAGDKCPPLDNECVLDNASPQILNASALEHTAVYPGKLLSSFFDPMNKQFIGNTEGASGFVISGCHFGSAKGRSFITMGDMRLDGENIFSWDDSAINVSVPYDAISGKVAVHLWDGLNYNSSDVTSEIVNVLPTIQYMQKRGIPGQVFGIWGSDFCESSGCLNPGAVLMGRYEVPDFPSPGIITSTAGAPARIIEWNNRRILAVVPEEYSLGANKNVIHAYSGIVQVVRADGERTNNTLLSQTTSLDTVSMALTNRAYFSILPVLSGAFPRTVAVDTKLLHGLGVPITLTGRNMAGCGVLFDEGSACPEIWDGGGANPNTLSAPLVELGSYAAPFFRKPVQFAFEDVTKLPFRHLEEYLKPVILPSTFPENLLGLTHDVIITNWDSALPKDPQAQQQVLGSFAMIRRVSGGQTPFASYAGFAAISSIAGAPQGISRQKLSDAEFAISWFGLAGESLYAFGKLNEPAVRIISPNAPIKSIAISRDSFASSGVKKITVTIEKEYLDSPASMLAGAKEFSISANNFVSPRDSVLDQDKNNFAILSKMNAGAPMNNGIPTFGVLEIQKEDDTGKGDRLYTYNAYNSIERYRGCFLDTSEAMQCPSANSPGVYDENDEFAGFGVYAPGGITTSYPKPILISATYDKKKNALELRGARFYNNTAVTVDGRAVKARRVSDWKIVVEKVSSFKAGFHKVSVRQVQTAIVPAQELQSSDIIFAVP